MVVGLSITLYVRELEKMNKIYYKMQACVIVHFCFAFTLKKNIYYSFNVIASK